MVVAVVVAAADSVGVADSEISQNSTTARRTPAFTQMNAGVFTGERSQRTRFQAASEHASRCQTPLPKWVPEVD